jgi:2-keto-4-pentenoate hydratase/2-oxohepta-3-ene-1,7-dioic acid hydratase in catechol pathway
VFNKQSICVAGPHDEVHLPRVSEMVDYDGELGGAIGWRCRHVPAEWAAVVIAGHVSSTTCPYGTGSREYRR